MMTMTTMMMKTKVLVEAHWCWRMTGWSEASVHLHDQQREQITTNRLTSPVMLLHLGGIGGGNSECVNRNRSTENRT